ncbi:MAG: ATP-binding cassette domain-containing protein, partial [Gammaproteobacteria bacterium]|nr:ATP-binding cassette domain-containing protein [Gammaproteobacteria bacterium]
MDDAGRRARVRLPADRLDEEVAVLSLEGVHKRYGAVHALQGLDMQVHEGQVYGFLGRNGAGKTT